MTQSQDIVKVAGHNYTLGGKNYVIPALSLRAIQQLKGKILSFQNSGPLEQVDDIADIAIAAFNRNYPEMTRDDLLDMIDMNNMQDVVMIIMGQSGLIPKKEEIKEGE